jgi:hypothetical protein
MTHERTRKAPPKAGPMIEALRGLGYSAATALADIIDNSIAAGANCVAIRFQWAAEHSTVSLLDDGRGMTDAELDVAMRLGELNPLATRSPGDLGRFGLGLKTASFSQARRLTVASARDGVTSCLRWDLDVLASNAEQEWLLLEGPHLGSEHLLASLTGRMSGTLVIWEVLDRIFTPGSNEQDFLEQIDQVEKHLSMVFHRFIQAPFPRLTITINGRAIAPWDPFLASHPATWSSPPVQFGGSSGGVLVSGYVLPHRDRLTEAEHAAAAGPDGWTAQQGFYVYRNERLLVAGSWLGLGRARPWTKEEPYRLARLRLDIPNTADADWKIDIRKSRARPPAVVRERLIRLAEDTRERARRVFAHRGQQLPTAGKEPLTQAWRADHYKGGVRYRIDLEHPAVRAVLDDVGALEPQLRAMLRVIEETIPVQRIWLDTAEAKETPRTAFVAEPEAEVRVVLEVLYRNLVRRKGLSPTEARARLLRTEPFNNYPNLIASLPDDDGKTGGT